MGCHLFLRGSYQPRDQTSVSWNFCTGRWILYHSANLRSSCSMDYWKVKSFPKADFHFSVKGTVESISGQWKKWKRGMCFGERFSTPIKRVGFVRKPCSPIPAWGCVPVEQLQPLCDPAGTLSWPTENEMGRIWILYATVEHWTSSEPSFMRKIYSCHINTFICLFIGMAAENTLTKIHELYQTFTQLQHPR